MNAISQGLSIAPTHITLSLPESKCAFYFLCVSPTSDFIFISCRCHSSSSMSLSVRLSIKSLGTSCTLLGVQCATPLVTPIVTVRHSFAYPARTSLSLLLPLPHMSYVCHTVTNSTVKFTRTTTCHSHTLSLSHRATHIPSHSHVLSLPYLK